MNTVSYTETKTATCFIFSYFISFQQFIGELKFGPNQTLTQREEHEKQVGNLVLNIKMSLVMDGRHTR